MALFSNTTHSCALENGAVKVIMAYPLCDDTFSSNGGGGWQNIGKSLKFMNSNETFSCFRYYIPNTI